MTFRRDELLSLLDLVCKTTDREIDCDELLQRVAAYLDRLPGGVDPDDFADVRQHLSVCPECLEEFEALVAAHDADGDAAGGANAT